MALDRFDPLRDMLSLRDAMERLFQESVVRPSSSLFPSGGGIPVDVAEQGDNFIVHATLPGVNPNDVEITVEGATLTIRGQTRVEHEQQGSDKKWIVRERRSGSFSRMITLPSRVNADGAQAQFEHGILTITLPKAQQSQARRIAVNQQPQAASLSQGTQASQSGQAEQSGPGAAQGGNVSASAETHVRQGSDQAESQGAHPLDNVPNPTAETSQQAENEHDQIDESSMESFPASDSPSWGSPRP